MTFAASSMIVSMLFALAVLALVEIRYLATESNVLTRRTAMRKTTFLTNTFVRVVKMAISFPLGVVEVG